MIQLLTREGKVLYELEQSEMFPDYRSVLREAIALNLSFDGLFIDSENIDGVSWQGNNLKDVKFINCSMKNNIFRECTGGLTFKGCNIQGLKISKCNFEYVSADFCNITNAGLRNSMLNDFTLYSCTLDNSVLFNCYLERMRLQDCTLVQTLFENCNLNNSSIFGNKEISDWYSETKFINCKMVEANLAFITDITQLYFWDVDINSILFEDYHVITEISSTYSKAVIAVHDDVVWWKSSYFFGEQLKIPFKFTHKEFIEEVESGYPKLRIDHDGANYELDNELHAVCAYIKFWLYEFG